jgi:tRNA G18 (ribose-2'-O)-methylase SpoU
MRSIIVIAHDIRSTHNVGSLLRTADGLGVAKVYLTGYTPYPIAPNDPRLPHIATKLDAAIHKTALGAEHTVVWSQVDNVFTVLSRLREDGFTICALEQTTDAIDLNKFSAPEKCAILLGSEVTGIDPKLLKEVDKSLVIPMFGKKESFNVIQAAAMALYQLRFH